MQKRKKLHHYSVKCCITYQNQTDPGSFMYNLFVWFRHNKNIQQLEQKMVFCSLTEVLCFTQLDGFQIRL